jgi:hypothetical protein
MKAPKKTNGKTMGMIVRQENEKSEFKTFGAPA